MAKLILSMDNLQLKDIALNKERTTIGRKPHNDIQIDNLAISGEHAVVITILNDSFLEDIGSTNGTFVNGQAVKKHFLQNGDTIELGKYRLKYVNDAPPPASAPDFERTMILRPGQVVKPAEGVSDEPRPTPMQAPPVAPPPPPPPSTTLSVVGVIKVLSGGNAGKELELTKSLTTLGKPGVQVAVIARRPLGYFMTHVEGATFPIVNGVSLDAQPRKLIDHDIVELAGTKMEFFIKS
ncbi:MAG: FHA domain-containing protein [Rhodocyclaceae bacterium]|nr:FHA domain-containing protein [Rhodocyclaceae bacterium]MBP6109177.1 FHA domain-containing protein [Rhodocyclaceae bacterium]MBP6278958.1 FHA domain-containing protein [Rhodocyclaceae bacterium]